MLRNNKVEYPRLSILHRFKDNWKIFLGCWVFTQACNTLQWGPSNHDAVLGIVSNGLEKNYCTRSDNHVSLLIIATQLIDLFLTAKDVQVFICVNERPKIVYLSKMESTNRVEIVLNQIHLLDELWNELDEWIELVAYFPTPLSNNLIKQVSSISDAEHCVSELCMAKDLRITERVLVWHENFELVLLDIFVDHFGGNRWLTDCNLWSNLSNCLRFL